LPKREDLFGEKWDGVERNGNTKTRGS